MHYKTKNRKGRGFSLVELLTVIAIIGIMSGIGIANISGVNNKAKTGAAQSNARNIASLYNNAVQAGASFTDKTDRTQIAEDLISESPASKCPAPSSSAV
jgi:prepilin-type N-terminal cleavage/methylation domain-containing protein